MQPQPSRGFRRHQFGRALHRRVGARARPGLPPARARDRQEGRDHRRRAGRFGLRLSAAAQGPCVHDTRLQRAAWRHDALRHSRLSHTARRARRRNQAHYRHGGGGAPQYPGRQGREPRRSAARLRRRVRRPRCPVGQPPAHTRRRGAERHRRHHLPARLQRRPAGQSGQEGRGGGGRRHRHGRRRGGAPARPHHERFRSAGR